MCPVGNRMLTDPVDALLLQHADNRVLIESVRKYIQRKLIVNCLQRTVKNRVDVLLLEQVITVC